MNGFHSGAQRRVAVVGGGVSGLVSLKTALDYGFEAVCFEQRDAIGGLWNVENPQPSHLGLAARIYDQLYMNSAKSFYCFSDFPPLPEHPYYLSPAHLMEYLSAYSVEFGLAPHVRLGRKVTSVRRSPDHATTGDWVVASTDACDDGPPKEERFSAVLCCSGFFSKANVPPPFPGQASFKGSLCHSGKFWNSAPYVGKRVLLVGGSISAFDIASTLAGNGVKEIYILMREGVWVMPQAVKGRSWEEVLLQRSWRESASAEAVQNRFQDICLERFDHAALGLVPERPCFQGRVAISDDIDKWILSGAVTALKDELVSFYPEGVELRSGRRLNVDAVIWATGYTNRLPYFMEAGLVPEAHPQTACWEYMCPVGQENPTLWLIAMLNVFSAIPVVAELQARAACATLAGAAQLPSPPDMAADIQREKDAALAAFGRWPGMEVDGYAYSLRLARYVGCEPRIAAIAERDAELGELAWDGPLLPHHFRLLGPHAKWTAAAAALRARETTSFGRTAAAWTPTPIGSKATRKQS